MKFENSKKQGDWGLGKAIAYFTSVGWTVNIPLTDSQDYDLVIDSGDTLSRVQTKSATFKRRYFEINLSVKGGNKSNSSIKEFDNTKVEYVFICTSEGHDYLIPSCAISAKNILNLGPKYEIYKISR